MELTLEDKIYLNELFDFYGALLTEKQRTYYSYYYLDDYSLAEIANLTDVSRSAVLDQIQIAISHLKNYETVLGLHTKHQKRLALLNQLKQTNDPQTQASLIDELEKTE